MHKSIVAQELITPSVILDQFSSQPLGANRITLRLSDSEVANLSISITDISIPTDSTQNIAADFQATSSIDTPLMIQDSVLYLRGQLRVKKNWSAYYERYQKIHQNDIKARKPRRGLSLSLRMLNDSTVRQREVFFDKDGYFGSKGIVFSDTIEVRAIQIYKKMKFYDFTTQYFFNDLVGQHNYKLKNNMTQNLQDSSRRIKLSTFYHPDYTIDASGRRVLKTVNIDRKVDLKLQQMARKLSRGWFAEHPSYLDIDVQNDVTIPSYIYTVDEYIKYLYQKYPKLNGSEPVILYNNSEYDSNDTSGYAPSTIHEIKMVRLYNNYPRNPKESSAIMIYADIDGRNKDSGQGVTLHQVAGYMTSLPFYSPQYNTAEKKINTPYDDRLTLYWNPYINLNTTNSSIDILFHNNSNAKGFHVVINGMSDSGKLIYYSKSFIK